MSDTNTEKHRHELIVCSCGTVISDCGCRLRLLYVREGACDGCVASVGDLFERRQKLCGDAYSEVGQD